ncbi:hypothetical protein L218DRAFT_940521 [Marasmius fiardii PR-910]|nr:hypothetical protein L218DRAFT_940521 [Marasmius fiardii PR-910]
MSSNTHRDVSLPPISHIFRDTDSHARGSSLSLPPLRNNDGHSRTQGGTILAPGSQTAMRSRHDHAPYAQNDPISSGNYTTYQHQNSRHLYSSSNYHPSSHHEMSLSPPEWGFQPASLPSGHPSRTYSTTPDYSGGSSRDVGRSANYGGSTHATSRSTGGGQHFSAQAMRYSHPDQEISLEEQGSTKAKYECSYCGKGFLRPSALRIHLISHTGDKDYVCPEETCGRRFGVRSNMLRHIRLVHQNLHQSSGEELSQDEWIS